MRRFFSSAIVADSRAAFLPRPLSCARLQTLWSAEPQHDLFHKAILVPNAYRSFCPSSNVHEFRGRQRRLSSIDGSGIHRARQCGSVQTVSDRDMTASTQCRPNPSNPVVEKSRNFHQHWTIATACPGNTRRTMCGIFTTLCVQVRFRTRTPLSNVPTRCRKVHADCVNTCIALSVNDSCEA